MVGTILVAVLIIAVGARAADAVRLRQQEVILTKLPTAEAVTFYRLLRRRAWKVRILRGMALLSLLVLLYARNRGRYRALQNKATAAATVPPAATDRPSAAPPAAGYLPQRR